MSSRKIKSALTKKGIRFSEVYYGWQATPGESVPGYTVSLHREDKERLERGGYDILDDFENADEALEWVAELPNWKEPRHD